MPKAQRKRNPKTSNGEHKMKKNPQTALNKVLMGKGVYASINQRRTHRARKILIEQEHDVFSGHRDYASYV